MKEKVAVKDKWMQILRVTKEDDSSKLSTRV